MDRLLAVLSSGREGERCAFDPSCGDTPCSDDGRLELLCLGGRLRFIERICSLPVPVVRECEGDDECGPGHVRMVLAEPADIQIQNIHSSLVMLNLAYEEAREPRMRTRGMARLSMANQDSVLQGLDRGEADLDSTGPDADPWAACPQLPVCVQVDLTGSGAT